MPVRRSPGGQRGPRGPRARRFDLTAALDRAAADPRGTPALLLEGAARLFAMHGFEGVRTRDVAAAAGVTVATLHFHWRDKRTLYRAVQQDVERRVLDYFRRLGSEQSQGRLSLEEAARRWMRWSIDLLTEHPHLGRLELRWFLEGHEPGRPNSVARGVAPFRAIVELLRSRMSPERAGDADLVVLLVAAAGLVAFSDAPTQQALIGGSVLRDAAVRDRYARFAERLLAHAIGRESLA